MAKVKAKGSLIKTTIAASLTTILQCTEINIGAKKNRTLDVECLDDSGVAVEMMNDGAVTQEEVTATILYDPDSTVHQFITDTIDLGAASFPIASSVVFADATPASATFNAVGFGFSVGISVKGVTTGNISITCAGLVTYPT
jgi:phage-related minor tail protein